MSANVIPLRPFQSALRFRDRPNVFTAIVRAIRRDLDKGGNGQAPLREQRAADRTSTPDDPEAA